MSHRTRALTLGFTALLAVGVVAAFAWSHESGGSATASSATTPAPPAAGGTGVASTSAPAPTVTSSGAPTTSVGPVATDPQPAASDPVEVALTYVLWDATAGQVQASGFVSGLVSDTGSCQLTLTRGSRTVSAEAPASAGASTTSCGLVAVPGGDLEAGSWTAVLSYRSDGVTGSSESAAVEVPVR